ncbi:ecto-ADP-ribosyltransferase 5-like [Spea bombifrons]|uniref:ecto-ADP-ribosyltransferase 5-like n=1 Tax=Spea bombifrons TaxID=233779 RepID=UPI00234A1727|nr:ecto-ADP-ribosyltransferase 5-like [Spea bombifrons]
MAKRRLSVLLLPLICALIPGGRSQIHHETLDMASTAFDDQYVMCSEDMEASMASMLNVEKSLDPDFRGAWEKAESRWEKRRLDSSLPALPKGFRDEHGIAILVYTDKDFPSPEVSLPSRFNEAVRTAVASRRDYLDKFHFKVLHYYLTTALQLLEAECRLVYRGIRGLHFVPPEEPDALIRFGQFTSSSMSQKTAEGFGRDSFFHITTCHGVDIGPLSTNANESEVLIPGDEIFHVSNFTNGGHQFVLTSTKRRCQYYNCALLGGGRAPTCCWDPRNSVPENVH